MKWMERHKSVQKWLMTIVQGLKGVAYFSWVSNNFFKKYINLCIQVFYFHVGLCTTCAYRIHGNQKNTSDSLEMEDRRLFPATWMLGIVPRSSRRASSALKHRAISSALAQYLFIPRSSLHLFNLIAKFQLASRKVRRANKHFSPLRIYLR